jgi:TPP-dependent pyruvate/acetoin dehydrogenase alpha subunit
MDEKDIVAIEQRVTEEIEEAVKFAEESPELAYERLAEFTYKE